MALLFNVYVCVRTSDLDPKFTILQKIKYG